MTFLPIVDRELRVASRKRSTFWTRVSAAITAFAIGVGLFILEERFSFVRGTGAQLGKVLFGVLTWFSFAVAISIGLFFTSDCLSEEKREGTLGFLFLTDLAGYDVVLGKMLATSLRGVFPLFAVLPVLGITLLMGGVTGAHFWKASLALVNAMFCSLAAGLFVSAMSRDPQRALSAAIVLLVVIAGGGPGLDAWVADLTHGPFQPRLSYSSPVYLFVLSDGWKPAMYWSALAVNQLIAWLMLAGACFLLPRIWQTKARSAEGRSGWKTALKYGRPRRRAALRAKLLSLNPVLWLACRERLQAFTVWALTLVLTTILAVTAWRSEQPVVWYMVNYFTGFLTMILYVVIAAQAGRFFVDLKRSGALEMILVTPVTMRQVIAAQWRALGRGFVLPLALFLAGQTTSAVLSQRAMMNQVAQATAAVTTVKPGSKVTRVWTRVANPQVALVVSASANLLSVAANLAALCCFGMWMGMTSKNAHAATLKTICFVQVIPWFVIAFVSALTAGIMMAWQAFNASGTSSFLWYPFLSTLISTVLIVAKDIGFSILARRGLTNAVAALR